MAAPRGVNRREALPLFLVALFLLACWPPVAEAKGAAARSAASSSGGSGSSTSISSLGASSTVLVDNSPRALAASAAIANSSSAILGNYTFRCADLKTFRPGVDIRLRNGNGFTRIYPTVVATVGPNVTAQLAKLPVWGNLTFNPSIASGLNGLDGANYVFMEWIANQGNFDMSVDFVNLPPAILNAGDWTTAYNYVLNTLNYDCIICPVIVDAERTASMTFVAAHQPFGYTVVATSVVYVPKSIGQVLFAWTDPFIPIIWLCTVACLVFSTLVMYLIEGRHNEDDFGLQEFNVAIRLGRGLFRALSNFCAVGSFSPVTPAGQTFGVSFSFAMLLVQSAYTANLAAFFTKNKTNQQTIQNIYSFPQLNLPACISSDLVLASLMQANFPTVKLIQINGGPFAVLDAVNNGTCAGAVLPDADANYVLGIGDTTASYCSLSVIGNNLNSGFYGFAFNKKLPPAVIKAINDIVIDGLSLGTYGSLTGGYFSTDRTQGSCAAYLQQQQQLAVGDILTPLSFNQLAGIFFVLVLGAGASLVVWGLFMIAAKMDSKKLAAQGVNTVNDFTATAQGAAKTLLTDPLDTQRYVDSRFQGNKGSLNTFSGQATGIINPNPLLDFQPRPGEQPLQTTFRLLVSQIRDDVATDMFRVPEALLHSGKRALAQGMYVRARAEVVDGEGMIIGDVNLEGTSVGQLCMLHGLMTPDEAAHFQNIVVAILKNAEARSRYASQQQQQWANGQPPHQKAAGRGNGHAPPQQSHPFSFVDGLMASIGLGNQDWRRDHRPADFDHYGRSGQAGMPLRQGGGHNSSDRNLQNMGASPLVTGTPGRQMTRQMSQPTSPRQMSQPTSPRGMDGPPRQMTRQMSVNAPVARQASVHGSPPQPQATLHGSPPQPQPTLHGSPARASYYG